VGGPAASERWLKGRTPLSSPLARGRAPFPLRLAYKKPWEGREAKPPFCERRREEGPRCGDTERREQPTASDRKAKSDRR